MSLGERPDEDLAAWREAGADRYLLRFETSDEDLYRRIHPDLPGRVSDRLAILRTLQDLGFEAGTGIMVGIPGQTHASIADDIDLFRGMDMDMIGIGPFLPHPATPLGSEYGRRRAAGDWPADQAANDELTTCKVVALTRLARPDANLPATTALSLVDKASRAGPRPAARRQRGDAEPDASGVPGQVRDLPREGRRARDRRGHRREHPGAARGARQDGRRGRRRAAAGRPD